MLINFNYSNNQSWKISLFGGTFIAPRNSGPSRFNELEPVAICRGNSFASCLTKINSIFDDLVRVKKIMDRALSVEEIRDLYKKACETPSRNHPNGGLWFIKFGQPKFEASCCGARREIMLGRHLDDDMALSFFVFELTNAVTEPRFADLVRKAAEGLIDCETYVKSIEAIEFEGAALHHRIIKLATEELRWNRKMDAYRCYENVSFEQYWHQAKESAHANNYRNQYKLIVANGELSRSKPKNASFFKFVINFLNSIYSLMR